MAPRTPSKSGARKRPAKTSKRRSLPAPQGVTSDAFGLVADGNCLAPTIEAGETILVEPDTLPRPGELAVVWFRGGLGPVGKVLHSPLFGYPHNPDSDAEVVLRLGQLQPPRLFQTGMGNVAKIARCCGVYDKRGSYRLIGEA
jgi:hypothetical protein